MIRYITSNFFSLKLYFSAVLTVSTSASREAQFSGKNFSPVRQFEALKILFMQSRKNMYTPVCLYAMSEETRAVTADETLEMKSLLVKE